jgi:hypothetical protein
VSEDLASLDPPITQPADDRESSAPIVPNVEGSEEWKPGFPIRGIVQSMKLWIVDRETWKTGENAAHVVRAYSRAQARKLAAEVAGPEGAPVWLDEKLSNIRELDGSGTPAVVNTCVATPDIVPCDEQPTRLRLRTIKVAE